LTDIVIILNALSIMTVMKQINESTYPADEKYDVDESFPLLMSTCVKYMRETLNARFAEKGYAITSEQWVLLTLLADQDGVTQLDLAKRSDKTEVSTLNLLRKLENNDLVIRRPDPVDGRSKRVYLTNEGRKLQKSLISSAKANIARMSRGLESEDIEKLKSILRVITRNLKI